MGSDCHVILTHELFYCLLKQIGSLDGHYLFVHNRIEKRSAEYSHNHHSNLKSESQVLTIWQ